MNVMTEIAEARASALSLRASAHACGPEQGPLKFRLVRTADALNSMVLLAVRGIERVEVLETALRASVAELQALEDRTKAVLERAQRALQGEQP